MVPYLEIADLTKQYSEGKGIRDVSFSCPEGSFTVLLGPSGAGKTTIALAGMIGGHELARGELSALPL